jgi:hypothetical protein
MDQALTRLLTGLADQSELTDNEWLLLYDLLNGTMLFDPQAALIRCLDGEIEDAVPHYFEKWDVSRPTILAKIQGLDPLHRLAVVNRVALFWHGVDVQNGSYEPEDPRYDDPRKVVLRHLARLG